MERLDQGNGASVVRALPKQELLDSVQAAAHLGLTHGLFRTLHFFRCGPGVLTIRSKRLYRRSELDRLREQWCLSVLVRAEDRLSPAADMEDSHAPRSPYTSRPLPYRLDPLMRMLALRAIRHQIVISTFWMMGIIGGAICLILY